MNFYKIRIFPARTWSRRELLTTENEASPHRGHRSSISLDTHTGHLRGTACCSAELHLTSTPPAKVFCGMCIFNSSIGWGILLVLPAGLVSGAAQHSTAVRVHARGASVHPRHTSEEHRSEQQRQSPPNYTGWSPELARRDGVGAQREVAAAPEGGVLENTMLIFAEIERHILVRWVVRCSVHYTSDK